MKRILGLAALLGHALSAVTGIQGPQYQRQYGVNRQVRQAYRAGPRPTAARWWHDSKSLQQHAAILNALDKRQRRSEKLDRNTMSSSYNNPCLNARISNLNPFYVAK